MSAAGPTKEGRITWLLGVGLGVNEVLAFSRSGRLIMTAVSVMAVARGVMLTVVESRRRGGLEFFGGV